MSETPNETPSETPAELPNETDAAIREQAGAIVAQGQDVRSRIGQLVTETAGRFHLDRDGLVRLTRSVLEGTRDAVDRAVGHDPGSVLRQVVDGLGDGFSAAALACRLAFEEARARGKTFADEDLHKLRDDLKTLGKQFVDTVTTVAGRFRSVAADQLAALRSHAENTRQRVQPALESALAAAREHPLRFTGESAGAGLAVSRQALGSLFTAIGRRLQEAGQRLSGTKQPE
jgi:ElaB/YqjD/DUF883 family membrane-anchored ribosome-binding protein